MSENIYKINLESPLNFLKLSYFLENFKDFFNRNVPDYNENIEFSLKFCLPEINRKFFEILRSRNIPKNWSFSKNELFSIGKVYCWDDIQKFFERTFSKKILAFLKNLRIFLKTFTL